MKNKKNKEIKGSVIYGILLTVIIGTFSYYIKELTGSGLADPLLIALLIGIALNLFISKNKKLLPGIKISPKIFIPIGIIFYGLKNLNFSKFSQVNISISVIIVVLIIIYYITIIIIGKLLRQKDEITYLTATGSAICGASAIAITAPAVKADDEDVSISLLSITIVAIFGLFMLIPLISITMSLDNQTYALLSASTLQFTGFVKAAVSIIPILETAMPHEDLLGFALSVKAVRYLGLLLAIPLFSSLIRKRLSLPWYLWTFLFAGIIGTLIYNNDKIFYSDTLVPVINPIYNILWATAMAAIGINSDLKSLLAENGLKALLMAFIGFIVVVIGFFILINFVTI